MMTSPPVKATLYPHQVEGWQRAVDTMIFHGGGYGLLYEMGCGKTLTAIAVVGTLFQKKMVRRLLVIAPSSVCPVWPREFAQYADFPFNALALTGSVEKCKTALAEFANEAPDMLRVAVINYEKTWRMPEALSAYTPDMIICDESHRIKTYNSRQSKAIHKLGDRAEFRMILTGTPVQNNPLDFWSQYRFMSPAVFGGSFIKFRARYAVMGGFAVNGKPVQIVGYRHLDELTEKAYTCASRVTKAECLTLPPQTFETRYVELSPKGRRLYKEMKRESIAWLNEMPVTANNVLSRLLILQRLTGGWLQPDESDTPVQVDTSKLDALEDLVSDILDAGDKVVVFVRFLSEYDSIRAMLDKHKIQHSDICGATLQSERGAVVERFQADPAVKVFVAQVDSAGLGITLTAAKVAVFYSPTWNYASYQQALGRTHRIGCEMHDECHYIHLICPDTVDEDVMEALENKKSLADLVVDRKDGMLRKEE